jgi:O-antigen polymerase
MALLLVDGTELEPQTLKKPVNKLFIFSVGLIYLMAANLILPNIGGLGLQLPHNGVIWWILIFALALGLRQIANNQLIRYTRTTIVLFLSCVLITIPILFSDSHLVQTQFRLVGLWLGLTLFVILQQLRLNNKHKQRLLWFIILSTIIQTILSYGYLTLNSLIDTHQINNPLALKFLQYASIGNFQDINNLGSFLITGIIASGYLLTKQPKKYNISWSVVSLLYLTPLLIMPLITIFNTPLLWLAIGISLCLLLPYMFRCATHKRKIGWTLAVFVGMTIGLVITQKMPQGQLGVNDPQPLTTFVYTLPQLTDMLIEKPFTGYGYGNFESEYILYTARQYQLNHKYPTGLPQLEHPQNEVLLWAVEGGIWPLIGILLAVYIVLTRIHSAKKGTRLATLSLLLPIALQGQLDSPFYQSSIHWITFMILLFWVDQRVARYKSFRTTKFQHSLANTSAILLPIVATIYLFIILHSGQHLMRYEATNDVQSLSKIIEPLIWQERIKADIAKKSLQQGIESSDPKLIQRYIDWSLSIIPTTPKPELYQNLILAYGLVGEQNREIQTRLEAQFLFPALNFTK